MSRFEQLYEGYCDGTLSEAEREEFLELLRRPEHRARFVELSTFEALVGDELGVSREKISSSKMRAIRPRRRVPEKPAFPAWIAACVGAAAILLMLLFGAAAGPKPSKPPAPAAEKAVEAKAPAPPDPEPERPRPPVREERDPAPLVVPPPLPPAAKAQPSETPRPLRSPPKEAAPDPAPPKETAVAAAPPVARVEAVEGRVLVAGEAVRAGRDLRPGEAVETSSAAAAWIKFPDGALMTLGPEARVVDLKLEKGWAAFDVPKQPRPFVVAGPHAEATVLGTEFTLSTGAGYTRLDVREGRVRFSRGVSSVVVGAGQWSIAHPGQDLAVKAGPAAWRAPPAGLLAWFKADAYKGGVWTDHSGLGHHATQPAAGSRPQDVEGALRFDGADDFLELPSQISEFRAGLSVWVVANVAAGPATSRFIDLGAGPSCDNVVFGRKEGNLAFWAYANGQTRGKIELPGAVSVDKLAVYGAVAQPGGRVVLYRNGVPLGAGTTSPLPGEARKPNFVGKSNYAGEPTFRGEISEILLYQRAVTDAERQHIEAYLGSKYLDPTLPAAMPRTSKK